MEARHGTKGTSFHNFGTDAQDFNSGCCRPQVKLLNGTAFLLSTPRRAPTSSNEFNRKTFIPPHTPLRNDRIHTPARWRCKLPGRLGALTRSLRVLDDPRARYLHLIQLTDNMPVLPDNRLFHSNRVPGCTSISHVEVVLGNNRTVQMRGFSDSKVARGLIALVILGLNGCTTDEIALTSAEQLLEASGLRGTVSPTRMMGLTSIIDFVQSTLEKSLSRERKEGFSNSDKDLMEGRWTGRQGEDVAVLLSGGVDSSVALRRVQESGARPHAFYLKIWLEDELAHLGSCPWEEDMEYATAVCAQAGVRLVDVPFQQAYWDEVVSYTVSEAKRGRTPNPDIMCNSRIKFGAFFDRIGRHYDKVVTGHYARRTVDAKTGLAELRLSSDLHKDQTYFLAHLRQDQISAASFPLGDFSKNEVRELARVYDLPNKARKDSQGICFLGKLKFDDFLGHHLGHRLGSLVEFETGQELGKHKGFWFFTIGQRRGVGLSGGPWYVVCKDVERNVVFVSKNYRSENQQRNRFEFETPLWISGNWPRALGFDGAQAALRVKTRHGPKFHEALVTRTWVGGGTAQLGEADKGLAPGQFSAFYDTENRCLGSAVISNDISVGDAPSDIIQLENSSKKLQAHF